MDYYAAYSWPEPHRQCSNKARAFSLKWNLFTMMKPHDREGNQSSLFTAVLGCYLANTKSFDDCAHTTLRFLLLPVVILVSEFSSFQYQDMPGAYWILANYDEMNG